MCLGPFQKLLEEGQMARQDESSLPEGRTMFSRVLEVLGGAEGTMYLQLLIQQGAQDSGQVVGAARGKCRKEGA